MNIIEKRGLRYAAILAVAAVAGGAGLATLLSAQQNGSAPGNGGEPEILRVRDNIYVIGGAGANITMSAGSEGILLVDTGTDAMADKVLAAINRLMRLESREHSVTQVIHDGTVLTGDAPPKPIRFIVNTSARPEHTGGNVKLVNAGKTFTGGNVAGDLGDVGEGAAVLSHENVLQRLSDAKMPFRGLPTETYFGGTMKLSHFFNGEGVVLYHIPNAVTDGDSLVYFRNSDVIAAGDTFIMGAYPPIDLNMGGSVQGELAALNRMLEMVVPEFRSEGGTFVVPGHGRLCDTADLAYYRDMVTIIRDRIADSIKKGMTLDQVKASKPTEDWDPRFGRNSNYTPDMFVEAIYKSLMSPPAAKK